MRNARVARFLAVRISNTSCRVDTSVQRRLFRKRFVETDRSGKKKKARLIKSGFVVGAEDHQLEITVSVATFFW